MPAESGMIRRLRAWSEAEIEKAAEIRHWREEAARMMQNAYASQMGCMGYTAQAQQTQMTVQTQNAKWAGMRPCTEQELARRDALGSFGSLLTGL